MGMPVHVVVAILIIIGILVSYKFAPPIGMKIDPERPVVKKQVELQDNCSGKTTRFAILAMAYLIMISSCMAIVFILFYNQ